MFLKNINAIEKTNSHLAEKLSNISLEEARQDINVYNATSGDLIISYKEKLLDDADNPIEQTKQNWIANTNDNLSKNDIVIVFGLGLGYLFKRAYISSNSKILIYEPNTNILRFVLEYVDFSNELSDKRVFLANDEKQFENFFKHNYLSKDKLEFIYPKGYLELNSKELISISDKIIEISNAKNADLNTTKKFAKLWVENNIKNLSVTENSRPLNIIKDKFKGTTALITAAGPSLNSNIETIKKNRDKFIIFTVNKSLDFLLKNGIIPDFLLVADAQYVSYTIENLKDFSRNINLISTTRVDSCIYNQDFNAIFNYYLKNDTFNEALANLLPDKIQLNETEGTTVSQAYYSAKIMGCKNIIFSGLDLALKDEEAYANGEKIKMYRDGLAIFHQDVKKLIQVKSAKGGYVTTRDDYEVFIHQFESLFTNNNSLNIYNTSDFGAYIKGMIYEPISKILEVIEPVNFNINEEIQKICAETKESQELIFKTQKNLVEKQKKEIINIQSDIKSFLQKNKVQIENSAFEKLNENIFYKLNEIKKTELSIISSILDNVILNQYFQIEILDYSKLNKEDEPEKMVEARKKSIIIFEQFLEKIDLLLEKISQK